VATSGVEKIQQRIISLELTYQVVKDDAWFVAYAGTAREAAEALGMRQNDVLGNGLVVSINNYSGRASPDVWEWLKLNWPVNG
jgi:hypothetical protein